MSCIFLLYVDNTGFVAVNSSQQPIARLAGEEVVLDCTVYGTPSLTITWFKDGQILSSTDNNIFISHGENGVARLRINRSTIDDSGEYRCVATNGYVSESRTLTVNISGGTCI